MSQQKIPLKIRANYVAYIRVTAAIRELEYVPSTADKHPNAAKAIKALEQWQGGLYDRIRSFIELDDLDEDDDEE